MEGDDTEARFAISLHEQIPPTEVERNLAALLNHWSPSTPRQSMPDADWIAGLASFLQGLAVLRINHARRWVDVNLERFHGGPAAIDDLRRQFDNTVIEMKTNVQLCKAKCASCYLLCVRGLLHEGDHNCRTSHGCAHNCGFCEVDLRLCGTPYVFWFRCRSPSLKRPKRWASWEAHVCESTFTDHPFLIRV